MDVEDFLSRAVDSLAPSPAWGAWPRVTKTRLSATSTSFVLVHPLNQHRRASADISHGKHFFDR